MAHKKGGGSSRNGRDSNAQRLGVKRFAGENVNAGETTPRKGRWTWKRLYNLCRDSRQGCILQEKQSFILWS